jgi:hypothetical protein
MARCSLSRDPREEREQRVALALKRRVRRSWMRIEVKSVVQATPWCGRGVAERLRRLAWKRRECVTARGLPPLAGALLERLGALAGDVVVLGCRRVGVARTVAERFRSRAVSVF